MSFSSSSKRGYTENVGLVIGDFGLVAEIGQTFCTLDHRGDALEAHAGIDVLRGQFAEGAVRICIELDENQVPDFNAAGIAFVHQLAAGLIAGARPEDRAGRASDRRAIPEHGPHGTGIAHHPKIVLLVAVDDVDRGIESGFRKNGSPGVVSFLVEARGIVERPGL